MRLKLSLYLLLILSFAVKNIEAQNRIDTVSDTITNKCVKNKSVNKNVEHKSAYKLYNNQGVEVGFNSMIDSLAQNDVIFIGEYHNCSIVHWLELEIVKSLSERLDKNLTLGLEMLECDNQLIIDEYLEGLISEERYLSEAYLWPNYKLDYAPIVNFAKENSIPVVATNIPRRYARAVSERGLDVLNKFPDDSKKYFEDAIPLIDTAIHKSDNFGAMGGKKMDAAKMKRFVQAQAIKDAVMAVNIARNGTHPFVHINGNLHSDKKESIVTYLLKESPNLKVINITTLYQDDISSVESKYANRADFYIVVPSNTHKSY